VEWASSAVYAAVNTQRRALARGLATEYIARQRALSAPEIQADQILLEAGTRELADAKDRLEKGVKRAYQHVVYLSQPDPDIERTLATITFEDDNQTALDGTQVWKALVERDKAFDTGQFTAKALLHNLRDSDYGRPLSEIRDSFYNTPRLPLLHSGERDLQSAIYDAVRDGQLQITDALGTPVAVTDSSQLNLASAGLRLVKPRSSVEAGGLGLAGSHPGETGSGPSTFPGGGTPGGDITPASSRAEKFVTFPLVGNLLQDSDKAENLAHLFRFLYTVLDERKASYAQGTLQFVLDAHSADKIAELARALGLTVTIREQ
jgi:hypothetical protein